MSDISEIDDIIEEYLRYLDGHGDRPNLDGLSPEDRAVAAERIELIDALRLPPLPDPEDDPIARALGFDRPNEIFVVNGRTIAARRSEIGLKVSQLVKMITNAGGTITRQALFRLEQDTAAEIDQPLASALAAALEVPISRFEIPHMAGQRPNRIQQIMEMPSAREEIFGWAKLHGRDVVSTRRLVQQRLSATRFRADDELDEPSALELVRAVLAALEG